MLVIGSDPFAPGHACGDACAFAKSDPSTCVCACGGRNHGAWSRPVPAARTPWDDAADAIAAREAAAWARLPVVEDDEPW